jgi:hypothetical protein
MRHRSVWILCLAFVVVFIQPARAGGWWTTLDIPTYVGVGEALDVKIDEVMYESIEGAQRAAETPFFAYLVESFDRDRLDRAMTRPQPGEWWRPLGTPIEVGTVTLFGRDANVMKGRVHIDMPDVVPGRYFLMLCDEGCRSPLGNHIPVPVTVPADPFAARTARRLESTNERMTLALARLRSELRQTRRQLAKANGVESEPVEAVAASNNPPEEGTPPWIAYAGWFIAGLSLAVVIGRSRGKGANPDILIDIPDDARQLTKTMSSSEIAPRSSRSNH